LSPAQAVRAVMQSPWIALYMLEAALWYPAIRLTFAGAGVRWGRRWQIFGRPVIQRHRQSTMILGDGLILRSTVRSNPLGAAHAVVLSTRRPGAVLRIGDNFGMTGGVIVAEERVEIGHNVMLGANCMIIDSDFHPLDPVERRTTPMAGATAPIVIEDDVFIGTNTLVLKGVTIGASSVIGAGSVVTRDVPPGVIAAGNPARVIRPLTPTDKA
jgi:acetyltransferase-like isoleucine patch superfamily enzyme